MRSWVTLGIALVLSGFILAVVTARAAQDNFLGIDSTTVIDAQVVNPSKSVTSTAYEKLGNCTNVSVQYRGLNSTSYKVEVLTTIDNTNYALPNTGSTIDPACTDTAWHTAVIQVPVSRGVKVLMTETSTNHTPTFTALVGAQ